MEEIRHKKGKIYYSMGEVCEMFDVNPSLIRFWEQKFDILKPHKNKKGNRMFTPSDVDNLKLIYHLVKEKGMTLAGAQKRIKDNREGVSRDMEVVDRLLGIKSILMEIRQELKSEADEIIRDPSVEGPETDEDIINEARKIVEQTSDAAEGFYPTLEMDEDDYTEPVDADELLEVQAQKDWSECELKGVDELDSEINILRKEAGISAEEADVLLESTEMLPLEGDITDMAPDGEHKRPGIYEQTLF